MATHDVVASCAAGFSEETAGSSVLLSRTRMSYNSGAEFWVPLMLGISDGGRGCCFQSVLL